MWGCLGAKQTLSLGGRAVLCFPISPMKLMRCFSFITVTTLAFFSQLAGVDPAVSGSSDLLLLPWAVLMASSRSAGSWMLRGCSGPEMSWSLCQMPISGTHTGPAVAIGATTRQTRCWLFSAPCLT